jgi:hypothetical protein
VFENRVLRRTLGPKRDKVTGEWRRLNNEELHDLYSSLNFPQVVRSTQMRQVGMLHIWGEERYIQGFGWEPEERGHLENLGTDGRIILKWISKKRYGRHGRDLSGLGQ